MTTAIAANPFIGKTTPPTQKDLSKVLGSSEAAWHALLSDLDGELGVADSEWHSYSPKAGWALEVKKGSRTILYMSPRARFFLISFTLGDKAMKAVLADGLPAAVVKIIR